MYNENKKTLEISLYHHRLIKILLEAHLRAKGDNWQRVLVCNHFIEVHEEEMSTKIRIWRRILSNPNPKTISGEEVLIIDEVEHIEVPPGIPKDDIPLCKFLEKVRQKNEKEDVRRKKSKPSTKKSKEKEVKPKDRE